MFFSSALPVPSSSDTKMDVILSKSRSSAFAGCLCTEKYSLIDCRSRDYCDDTFIDGVSKYKPVSPIHCFHDIVRFPQTLPFDTWTVWLLLMWVDRYWTISLLISAGSRVLGSTVPDVELRTWSHWLLLQQLLYLSRSVVDDVSGSWVVSEWWINLQILPERALDVYEQTDVSRVLL